MAKTIYLPKSNLLLLGSGHDVNGNKIIKLRFVNSRGFSIQTNGNLGDVGRILRGLKSFKDMETISARNLNTISKEVCGYIKKYGTATQKKRLRIYK